eukprot:2876155-Pyramimonas_sp.AAC.1
MARSVINAGNMEKETRSESYWNERTAHWKNHFNNMKVPELRKKIDDMHQTVEAEAAATDG